MPKDLEKTYQREVMLKKAETLAVLKVRDHSKPTLSIVSIGNEVQSKKRRHEKSSSQFNG